VEKGAFLEKVRPRFAMRNEEKFWDGSVVSGRKEGLKVQAWNVERWVRALSLPFGIIYLRFKWE